jgi:hypothetical protein
MTIQCDAARRTIAFDGVLDLDQAGRVMEAALAFVGKELTIDLHAAREIHDAALVNLVLNLRRSTRPFKLNGLMGHHRRILAYFNPRPARPPEDIDLD